MNNLKTIIFDLDGTLLPMDTNQFMTLYSQSVTESFKDFEDAQDLFKKIMTSVHHTVSKPNDISNEKKFFTYFETLVKEPVDAYYDHFLKFYEGPFQAVQASTYQSNEIIESIKILKDKNYNLVIATNPIFPMVANRKRIEWAGLNIEDFSYVTSFEENTACKPHLSFYEQVLNKIDHESDEILMVGNDAQEDLPIKALGAKTFLVTNHLIDRKDHLSLSDYHGTYSDFLEFVKSLERLDI